MLCRQFLSASSTSSFENLTTAQSFHSFSETMSSFSSEIVRLKSTFHSVFPPYPPQDFINFYIVNIDSCYFTLHSALLHLQGITNILYEKIKTSSSKNRYFSSMQDFSPEICEVIHSLLQYMCISRCKCNRR